MTSIPKHSLQFLNDLSSNNNREWFHANKETYTSAQEGIINFADSVLNELRKHDDIQTPTGKKSMFRIYRDVRFSKDKTPYNIHWSCHFKRSSALLRGGYYFRIQENNFIVGGGFWGPNPKDLKRIREEIDTNPEAFKAIIEDKNFKKTFGEITGSEVKTAPKGYRQDNPNIALLRKKQFILLKTFTQKEVLNKDYHDLVNQTFQQMRPFFNLMSEVLTTDSNGEPIIQ